jgi:hypothetical protein
MKYTLSIALVAFLALSTTASAQRSGSNRSFDYFASVALGSAYPYAPESFDDGYKPGFGMMVDVGVKKSIAQLSANFDYHFFFADSPVPNDLNMFTIFAHLKVNPVESTARPYIFIGGGYVRYWVVDLNIYENVLGYGGGAGVELEIGRTRRLFLEGKHISAQTRETEDKANTQIIPVRIGLTWIF